MNDNKKVKGLNANGIQEKNRSIILQILLEKKNCTRTELAHLTGLTQAAITININELMQKGLVRETGVAKRVNGRKMMSLSLCYESYKVIAARLNRACFEVTVCDISGKIYKSEKEPVSSNAQVTFERFVAAINKVYMQTEDIYAIGVAVPGPYLRNEGRIALVTEFIGWSEINIVKELKRKFDVPVYVEHDDNAAALAIWLYGDQDCREGTLACLDITEGVGAGIVEDGKILTGHNGKAAQIGHISLDPLGARCQCGNFGCMEMYCSIRAVEQMVLKGLAAHPESVLNKDGYGTDYKAVIKGVQEEDVFCIEIIRRVGFYVGCGIINLLHAYDPHIIVVTSELNNCGDIFTNTVRETVANRVLPELRKGLKIDFADSSINYIILGAAAIATNALLRTPGLILSRYQNEEESHSY